MEWKTLLAYITGSVDQELFLRNDYLVTENRSWGRVRSVKEAALARLILYDERSLRHVPKEYTAHYHAERPHQGKGNVILLPAVGHKTARHGTVRCQERLGGLLKYYDCDAA